jgi:hypothetical protein
MLSNGCFVKATIRGDVALLDEWHRNEETEEETLLRKLPPVHRNEFGFWISPAGHPFSNPIPCGFEIIERKIKDPSIPREAWESAEEYAHIVILNKSRGKKESVA